ncbi:MAG TPA: phosphatidate cytidylyltransferase, partial [Burkholderiales bacterium]|nr:phosphatidate cytidylyltransferase [Burkholderiales bacterium]
MFATRVITAVLALALFLAALFLLPPAGWMLCLVPALLLGAREWGALAGYGRGAAWVYGVATTAAAVALAWAGDGRFETRAAHVAVYGFAMAFWLLAAPLWLKDHWRVRGTPLALVGWIVLIPTWLALVQLQAIAGVLLIFMGVIWIADTTAYLAGRQWGRHKLAPTISPGKTWEGVAGAAAGVALYYLVLQFLVDDWRPALDAPAGAFAFAALLALSIEGDLFESWL